MPFFSLAQPVNDNCSSAIPIAISGGGFGLGVFNSSTNDITSATIQTGETFAPAIFVAGQTQKSIWYKFTLPTTRSLTVTLVQPGTAIAAGDAGFAIYRTNNCLPAIADLSTKLTPIATFGYTYHPCVDAGDYLIQVSAKNVANGPLGIQLTIADSTGAVYDHPSEASTFGVLTNSMSRVDFSVDCQSLENATEVCTALGNYQQYTKSTWHTFTTPAYFDYVAVLLGSSNPNCNFTNGQATFGYNLYAGDAKTAAFGSLPLVDGCDSFVTNGVYADKRIYRCSQLQPNTTYSIQLFYNENFDDNVRLAVEVAGVKPTQAPQPILSAIPASNMLGIVVPTTSGVKITGNDYLACNSRHAVSSCGPSLPLKPLQIPGNTSTFDLSTFFTFTLTSEANISVAVTSGNTYYYIAPPTLYFRLYNQAPTNNCASLDTSNIILQGLGTGSTTCLGPGTYTVQLMGSDSLLTSSYFYCTYLSTPAGYQFPILSNLGTAVSLSCTLTSINAFNHYSLSVNKAYDTINSMKPLLNGVPYLAKEDTFGCANTVMPSGSSYQCDKHAHKAIYRELTIGDANGDGVPDSGVLVLSNFLGGGYYGSGIYGNTYSMLFSGDANALAAAQNAYSYPDSIKGLTPWSNCLTNPGCSEANICVLPGTYTLVTTADSNGIGIDPGSTGVQFSIISTQHYSGPTAQNLASLWDTLGVNGGTKLSDYDYFSCNDNATTINGFAPPVIYGDTCTKVIYREFYLKSDAIVSIAEYGDPYKCDGALSNIALFTGKASDGLNTLQHIKVNGIDFSNSLTTPVCNALTPGWYTVASYSFGPTYAQPFHNAYNVGLTGGSVGRVEKLAITLTPACPGPKYDHPSTAAIDTLTNAPFLFQWAPRAGSTTAYPITDTTYTLYTEHFNCKTDKPFPAFIIPCDTTVNRIVYYVFQITKESYVEINTQDLWGEVFDHDVRKDSSLFGTLTPIQPCLQSNGHIELCRLQPGTYTLVVFAADKNVNGCSSVTPTLYIDNTGYSRFDNAINAYDFGVVPADSTYHNGKLGDVNPLDPGRAPSNDFFYCTTGAQASDPTDPDCEVVLTPSIYTVPSINNHLYNKDPGNYLVAKRDLWYSFVIDKPGYVYVKVDNKTKDKTQQDLFAVYQSNTYDSLPLSTHAANGTLDSTLAQGLTYIKNNITGYYCYGSNSISFYVNPCTFNGAVRYYVLVEEPGSYPYISTSTGPNSQVEVSVLVDSASVVKPKYDHYYQADTIGLNLGAGVYTGGADNFTCASSDPNDPFGVAGTGTCAPKTLWYKFTVSETGYIRYRENINGKSAPAPTNDLYLFEQVIPGDSTSKGLIYKTYTSEFVDSLGNPWLQQCISPGTYYLIPSGCSRVNETFQPFLWIMEQAGDFCSKPVVAGLNGAGAVIATVIVDCHTIGTDYGEFGPTLTCPPGKKTSDYKSSWFRIDVTGTDTLDVTAYLNEKTNASTTDINYRLMTGDCGAMQETSCVQDALTQNTYRCLAPGSYYIQVFTPVLKNGVPVTGTIDLHVSGVHHADTCAPIPKCLANANFIPQFDCTTDSSVRFINYSTYGSSIVYKWDFGNNGDTSSAVSPSYFYPVLPTDKIYPVKLWVTNTSCGNKDSVTVNVTIPGRPYVNLGSDLQLCNSDTTVLLNASSFPGATYYWQNGSTNPTFTAAYAGQYAYWVKVTYNGCSSIDTVNIFIDPIAKNPVQKLVVCPSDSVLLYDYSYYNPTYTWNTGGTAYDLYAYTPGTYWVDRLYKGCTVRDSFVVAGVNNLRPLGNDTAVCLSAANPYVLNATVTGATSYTWQDGSRSYLYNVTRPGQYWVKIAVATCTVTDTVNISDATPAQPSILGKLSFCAGDSTLLDAGAGYALYAWNTGDSTRTLSVKRAGSYSVSVFSAPACKAVSAAVQVSVNTLPLPKITGNRALCNGDSIVLSAGAGYAAYSWSDGETTPTIKVGGQGMIYLKASDANGCTGSDSVQVIVSPPAVINATDASICSGRSYTLPSGAIVQTAGNYNDTVRSASGCDSLISSIRLSVSAPAQVRTTSTSICSGTSYTLPSGMIVRTAGMYKDTLRSATGCDSLISIVNLAVISGATASVNAAVCAGQTYTLPSGAIVQTAGMYSDTLRAAGGCDSLITTVNLSVSGPAIVSSRDVSVCAGKSYLLPSGIAVFLAGTYKDTVRTVTGCDSLLTTVNLTVFTPVSVNKDALICAGTSYTLPSGRELTSAGVYTDTLHSVSGCDSLITTVNLSVGTLTAISKSISICQGAAYTLPSGAVIFTTGLYTDTLHSTAGCDSLVTTVTLRVLNPSFSTIDTALCAGQYYTLPSGRVIGQTGLYKDTLRSAGGCDSLITTASLIVRNAPDYLDRTSSICAGQTLTLPSGRIVSQTGNYSDTLRSSAGCDSLISRWNLTVFAPVVLNTAVSICSGQTYALPSGTIVTQPGKYADTLRYVSGCDSLITNATVSFFKDPDFGINPPEATVCKGDSVLLTAYGGDLYQWSPAMGVNSPATASTYVVPDVSGMYQVIITSNLCHITDTQFISVIVNPKPVVTVTKSNDISCTLSSATLNATGGVKYVWSPDATLNDPNSSNPVALPRSTTVYHVQVFSEQGCISEDSIEVIAIGGDVDKGYPVPNAFTPNNDGNNDCFGIKPSSWGNVSNFKLLIFNRKGQLMFSTTDPYRCWDGTWGGIAQPSDTYVYVVSAVSLCGNVFRKGTLILVR